MKQFLGRVIGGVKNLLSSLFDPVTFVHWGLGSYPTESGINITYDTAMTVSEFSQSVALISASVARLPFHLYRVIDGKSTQILPNHRTRDISYRVEVQPNPWLTPFTFKNAVIRSLLVYGRVYVWYPPETGELYILPVSSVTLPTIMDVRQSPPFLHLNLGATQLVPVPMNEVFRLVVNSMDGLVGRGLLLNGREILGRQVSAHNTQANIFSQGLSAGAVLFANGKLDSAAREKIREAYSSAMTGPANTGRIAILDNAIAKLQQVAMNPEDAQLTQQVENTGKELATLAGVPSHRLNIGDPKYANAEQSALDFATNTIDPLLVQFEEAATLYFLTVKQRADGYVFKFERDAIERADLATKTNSLERFVLGGIMTTNEAREKLNLPNIDGGDVLRVPLKLGTPDSQ